MKIGILATGTTPDELIGRYDSYANMFVKLFAAAGYQYEFETFNVKDDEFPQSLDHFDAWIITGSKFNVEDNDPWMLRLKDIIRELDKHKTPILGICFGHQIVADALGGKVAKNSQGWGVGLHRYQLTDHPKGVPANIESFTISAMHNYQVVEKPEKANVFATSEFCPLAAMTYGEHIMTFQAHPEFMLDYETELLALRKGEVIPDDEADIALASCQAPNAKTDSLELAKWMAKFITA